MLYFLITLFVFVIEYFVKKHMDQARGLDERRELAGGRLVLKKYYNTGTAGDFLSRRPRAALMVHAAASAAVCGGMLYSFCKKASAPAKLGTALLAGGGLSNLYDRLKKGHVVDYFSFGFGPERFRRLVFNLADFSIFAGVFFVMTAILRREGTS